MMKNTHLKAQMENGSQAETYSIYSLKCPQCQKVNVVNSLKCWNCGYDFLQTKKKSEFVTRWQVVILIFLIIAIVLVMMWTNGL